MGAGAVPHNPARGKALAPKVTHTEFQKQVVEFAHMFGWRHLHVRRSIGRNRKWVTTTNLKGWPDLWLMHPLAGYVAAELKVPPDKASPEQAELIAFLGSMPATKAVIWTPNDWPDIQATLTVRGKR